jgi:hypothetical protein
MDYWLKGLGGGKREAWLRDDWQNERDGLLLRSATFGRRPSMRTGDGIVYYAVGHQVVFAAGTVESLPWKEESDGETRWPWRVRVKLPLMVDFVHDGVPLDDLNVDERFLRSSIKQHSHIRLSAAEYKAAVDLLSGKVAAELSGTSNG